MSKAMYWDYQAASRVNYAEGRYVASWLNLFGGEEAKNEQEKRWKTRKPNTPRQKEIQRLWQQRGLLERTKANLYSVLEDKTLNWQRVTDKGFLASAIQIVCEQITHNVMQIKTVKERIPA